MSNGIVKPEEIAALDTIASKALEAFNGKGNFEAAFAVADAMNAIRNSITPAMMQRFMSLQNSSLGFRTDHDPGVWNKKENKYMEPYGPEVVKECVIEAVLRGVQVVGNQFNIISKRTYITKEGFHYLLKKIKGLTDLSPCIGIPKRLEGGVIVPCGASWKMNGKEDSLKADIPVKTDEYSSADQILGKAQRKLLARVYAQITGRAESDGDVDDSHSRIENPREQFTPKQIDVMITEPVSKPKPVEENTTQSQSDLAKQPTSPAPAPPAEPVTLSFQEDKRGPGRPRKLTPASTPAIPSIQDIVSGRLKNDGISDKEFVAFLATQGYMQDSAGDWRFVIGSVLKKFTPDNVWPEVVNEIKANRAPETEAV